MLNVAVFSHHHLIFCPQNNLVSFLPNIYSEQPPAEANDGGDAPPGGNLQGAILFTPLGPQTSPATGPGGTVGWSVFGQLYDTLTDTTENLFFGTESLGP